MALSSVPFRQGDDLAGDRAIPARDASIGCAEAFSGHRNPLMAPVKEMAEKSTPTGIPSPPTTRSSPGEKAMSSWIELGWNMFASTREAVTPKPCSTPHTGRRALQAAVGLKSPHAGDDHQDPNAISALPKPAPISKAIPRGRPAGGGLRALIYVLRGGGVDERQFNALVAIRDSLPQNERVSMAELKSIIRRQADLLRRRHGLRYGPATGHARQSEPAGGCRYHLTAS